MPSLADRIKETTTTTGTGALTLAGAEVGFRSFSEFADGETCYYVIAAQTPGEWEVGIGTVGGGGTTLARTTIISSSNADLVVNLSAGTKDVFVDRPASWTPPATTPGGSDGQLQYNNAGAFAGVLLEYDPAGEPNAEFSNPSDGGSVTISAGDSALSDGGGFNFFGGNGGTGGGNGGEFNVAGGFGGAGGGRGGNASITGGNGDDATGGNAALTAGSVTGTGNGGRALVTGGNGGDTSGEGGDIVLSAGSALAGNNEGGTNFIVAGAGAGSGADGQNILFGDSIFQDLGSGPRNLYLSADEEVTNTTLTNSALSVTLTKARKYAFRFTLFILNDAINEGLKVALNGTATVTALKAQISIWDDTTDAIAAFGRVTSLGSAVGVTTLSAAVNFCTIEGTVDINAGGTFQLQFAQNAAGANSGVHVQVGSSLEVVCIEGT